MLGLAGTAAVPSTRAADVPSSDDQSQIKAIEDKLGQLVDPADVRRYYADDAVLFDALAPGLIKGAAAIEKSFAAQLRGVRSVNTTVLHEETVISGSLAVVYSLQAIRVAMMDGTERRVVCRVSDIYRKQGAEWRIAHQHISYPIDPVSGQAQFALTPQP
ncbi:nuclear transport factor 2 family protein [Novosphingobium sp. PASSN1]|uniref:YybH family protein n=1 Tax=Novosphingobium sp. PASSN1 TaxID=2015561 RepID=UPI0025D39A62|nr:nuclear transport factor 2 family protein [Novosphingobium sp. PASSN1]